MAVTVFKTFSAGETLTASDLNSSLTKFTDNGEDFSTPATKAHDMNGNEFILDSDADTSITADTDDQIDFRVGGTDRVRMTNDSLDVISGTLRENGVSVKGNIQRQAGVALFKGQTARAMAMDIAGNMPLITQVFS